MVVLADKVRPVFSSQQCCCRLEFPPGFIMLVGITSSVTHSVVHDTTSVYHIVVLLHLGLATFLQDGQDPRLHPQRTVTVTCRPVGGKAVHRQRLILGTGQL
jgi:hypothetical protein